MRVKIFKHRNTAQSAQKPAECWGRVLRPGVLSINVYIAGFGDVRGSLRREAGETGRLSGVSGQHLITTQYGNIHIF